MDNKGQDHSTSPLSLRAAEFQRVTCTKNGVG